MRPAVFWGGFPLSTLVRARPGARRRLLAEANRARHRRQERRAIALYRQILLEEPRDVEVALRVAPLLAGRGEGFEAWQLFRMAAMELHRIRRMDASHAVLRDACRCVPHEYDAWRLRAELEQRLGREEEAFDTLLEGARRFDRPPTATKAIALLTRARLIEPWDPEVALDLARLYAQTGMTESALGLLAALAPSQRGSMLRRVRGLQWRITLSFYHAWRWLQSLVQERRGERDAGDLVLAAGAARTARERRQAEPTQPCIALDREASA